MKIMMTAALALTAAIGLAACSERSQDATANAADSIAADANATTQNAIGDVDAASDRAFGSAEQHMDNAGDTMDRTGDRIGNAADRAGDNIANGADHARSATGDALRDAGNAIDR